MIAGAKRPALPVAPRRCPHLAQAAVSGPNSKVSTSHLAASRCVLNRGTSPVCVAISCQRMPVKNRHFAPAGKQTDRRFNPSKKTMECSQTIYLYRIPLESTNLPWGMQSME